MYEPITGQTGHGQIDRKFNGYMWHLEDKIASQVSKINNYLIQYVTKTVLTKEISNKTKHVDPVVNIIRHFLLDA